MIRFTVAPAGDAGTYLRFADDATAPAADRVLAVLAVLDRQPPAGVIDVVPGYAEVLVIHDPARITGAAVRTWIEGTVVADLTPAAAGPGRLVEIPVLYNTDVGPDLADLAAEKGLSIADFVRLHAAPTYRCAMLGFRPGFPFLGGLDERLRAARLATPRLSVAAGSVGIGGAQTGIYPGAGPGGWRIIGRTPARLFDPARAAPFLIAAGDQVRFIVA